jgi:glutamate-1-semialdehyde 2,1-aminomutase
MDLIRWCEYNDGDSLREVMERDGEQVAAIIFEPVMVGGGVIAAEAEFLALARELADVYGALLVLDEVVTARLHPNGRGAALGVKADLTTLGKIIGGGLPVGAAGGRADVMEQLDPRRRGFVGHSGTFNGNPMTMAAGCASLDLLDDAAIERINGLGESFAAGLRETLAEQGLEAIVTCCGSLLQVHLETPRDEVRRYADINPGSPQLQLLHRAGLEEGVFFAGRGLMCVSTPMDEAVIERATDAFGRAAAEVVRAGAPAGVT